MLQQVASAPQRLDLIQRIHALQTQLDAALITDELASVGSLCAKLQTLQKQSARLPLSEEDYLTLADRHAALVQRVTDRCKELAEAKDFAAVTALGTKLKELRVAALPVDDGTVISHHETGDLLQTHFLPTGF
jgi:hypothetical protein